MDTITDAKGRQIEVAMLGTREQMRLMRACGPAADIQRYMLNAIIAASARSIDSVPVTFPRTADEVDALADKLGGPGITAIQEWIEAKAADAPTPEQEREQAKN